LKVLQPEKLKDPAFIEELKALQADLQVVVAFRMLPEVVWNMPPRGTLNLHASLLPQYRGAAPINWSIINGEKESGVTTFFLKHEIDTGDILFTEKVTLTGHETAGELHDRLMTKGAGLIVKTVKGIESGRYNEHPQLMAGVELKHAPKIFRAEFEIAPTTMQPGAIATDQKSYLKVAAADGFISLTEVQLEGKKSMGIEEFLRGNKITANALG